MLWMIQMKMLLSILVNRLLLAYVLLIPFVPSVLGANVTIGNFPTTTSFTTNAILPIGITNGGGGYITKKISVNDFVAGLTPDLSSFVAKTNGFSTNQQTLNMSITSGSAFHTNVFTVPTNILTLSGTAGNFYITLNGTLFNFTNNIFLGDYIRLGASYGYPEWVVTGITNANQTVAVWDVNGGIPASYTNLQFTLSHGWMRIFDNQPMNVGAMSDGGIMGAAGYSIGNRNGWLDFEGDDSALIRCSQGSGGSPNYLGFTAGLGKGGSLRNQFNIESGATFNSLSIKSTSDLWMRGNLTNNVLGYLSLRGIAHTPEGILTGDTITAYGTNLLAPTLTVSNTGFNNIIFSTSGNFNNISIGDQIIIPSPVNYSGNIMAISGTNIVVDTVTTAAFSSATPFINHALNRFYDSTPALSGWLAPHGVLHLTELQAGFTNTLTSVRIHTSPESDGVRVEFGSVQSPAIINAQYSAPYDSIEIMTDGEVSPSYGMTNSHGGNIAVGTGFTVTGASTFNSAVTFPKLTATNGITVSGQSNGRCGTFNLNNTSNVSIANTSVTANSIVLCQHGALTGTTTGVIQVTSITAGTGFNVNSSSLNDQSLCYYFIFEKQ